MNLPSRRYMMDAARCENGYGWPMHNARAWYPPLTPTAIAWADEIAIHAGLMRDNVSRWEERHP